MGGALSRTVVVLFAGGSAVSLLWARHYVSDNLVVGQSWKQAKWPLMDGGGALGNRLRGGVEQVGAENPDILDEWIFVDGHGRPGNSSSVGNIQDPSASSAPPVMQAYPLLRVTPRVLAEIGKDGLGEIPHGPVDNRGNRGIRVWSAVPVARRHGSDSPSLVLIAEADTHWAMKQANQGTHFISFPSGGVSQFQKFRGPKSLSWHADIPLTDYVAWMDRRQDWACLSFGVRVNSSQGPEVANFTSCHRPSLLPTVQEPNNLTLCYTAPPFIMPNVPEASGYIGLAPNILYHLRHGVDQVIVYLNADYRELALGLLAPFMARGLCAVVLVEAKYQYQERNQNDCLNRLKGRSRLYRGADFDEFLYAPKWRKDPRWAERGASLAEVAQLLLRKELYDFLEMGDYMWVKPPDLLHNLLTDTMLHWRNYDRAYKSLLKPERIAHDWIHEPMKCHENKTHVRRCNNFGGHSIEYAHVKTRMNETQIAALEASQNFTRDDFFVNESVFLQKQLCTWLREVGKSCDPKTWLPPPEEQPVARQE